MRRYDWLRNIPDPSQLLNMKRNISAARTPLERQIRAEAFLRNSTRLNRETLYFLREEAKYKQKEELCQLSLY
jgi:hypothetical protein